MIRALISGELVADPTQKTARNGSSYAVVKVSVPQTDAGRLYCSAIVFDSNAVERLMQLKAGASISLAGALRVGTYQTGAGETRVSLDMQADEVASTTPRPRKPKPQRRASEANGADIDWLGA